MKKLRNSHVENDKWHAPFLLSASFQGLIKFQGSHFDNGILYWEFAPVKKVKILLNQLKTKTEPRIPILDVFNATKTWWQQIEEFRNGEKTNEGSF